MTPDAKTRITRLGWGAVVSAVGHLAVVVLAMVAAVDSDGDTATAFWYLVLFGALGLLAAVLIHAASSSTARDRSAAAPLGTGAVCLAVAGGFAALSVVTDSDLAFLIVAMPLLALNLILLLAVRNAGVSRASVD